MEKVVDEVCMLWLDYKISKKMKLVSKMYLDEYLDYLVNNGVKLTKDKLFKIGCVVDCFFYNLQYSLNEDNTIVITRDRNDYTKPLVYNGRKVDRQVSYKYMMEFLSWLHMKQYVISEIGMVTGWHKHDGVWKPSVVKQSKLIISEKVLADYKTTIKTKRDIPPVTNVIRVKDAKKNPIQKRLTAYGQWACELLQDYNKKSKDCIIRAGEKEFDVQVVKVYNESSFEKGGRTYVIGADSVILKKENRKMLTFNDEVTVECDFKALHPRLVATIVGTHIPLNHDPYGLDVEGYDPKALRIICKLIVLCIFNATSLYSAMKAVHNEINTKTEVDENGNDVPLARYWKEHGMVPEFIELKYLCGKLLEHNPYMREYAFTGCGLDLQNLDSRIMDIVIEHFTFKGEFVLPVHDSIVVRESLKDEAVEVMTKAFAQVMGSADNCIVEVK